MPGWKCNFKTLLPHSTVNLPPHYTYCRPLLNEWKWLRMGTAQLWGLWRYRMAMDQSRVTTQPQGATQGSGEQDISFNFNFYFKCISSIFGEILSTTYLDSKWGEGRGGGGCGVITRRGINKGYEYAKGPSIKSLSVSFLEMRRGRNVSGIFITKVMQKVSSGKETDWQ